ncbi:hypothetical protein [Methylocella sp.]|uniref:hypothetical protein n=1 Tax=Methylocella sp. TaxID=1978226 RepID=UPI003784E8A7
MGRNNIRTNGGKALRLVVLAAAFAAPAGYAAAKTRHHETPAGARDYVGLYQAPQRSLTMDQQDQRLFDRSGTVGREGLGENPSHPEGPGNVSD